MEKESTLTRIERERSEERSVVEATIARKHVEKYDFEQRGNKQWVREAERDIRALQRLLDRCFTTST